MYQGQLEKELDSHSPILRTKRNVALMATHLAMILGATKIVYVAVEMNNSCHFYHFEPDTLKQAHEHLDQLCNTKNGPYYKDKPRGADEQRIRGGLRLRTKHTGSWDNPKEKVFGRYFNDLRENGVEVQSLTDDSVVTRAGAEYVRPEEAFSC